MANRDRLIQALDRYLKISQFKDHAPIGLQVEGALEVKKVVTGVSVNMALLKEASKRRAGMVIAHHGMFWSKESPVLKGHRKRRVAFLLEHDMTLLAYHLPLDAHPVVGNNARILKMLGARGFKGFGEYQGNTIGLIGRLEPALPVEKTIARLKPLTPGRILCFPGAGKRVRRVAVMSGGGGFAYEEAVEAGVDLFITGEPLEPARALVEETGVGFMALGHYNSEKPGIMALGDWLKKRFRIPVEFKDNPNPA